MEEEEIAVAEAAATEAAKRLDFFMVGFRGSEYLGCVLFVETERFGGNAKL